MVVAYDERMLLHREEEPSAGTHPERPDRVRAIWARLCRRRLAARCVRLAARAAEDWELAACHAAELASGLDARSRALDLPATAGHFRGASLTPDTYLNAHTARAARLSAGACVDVAAAVAGGRARAGLAVVRPPGHHAESGTAMGFCYYCNAAVAARAAQRAGARRVLVLDWDVHHGNGTQAAFERDPSVLYVSLHRHDGGAFFPGTGAAHDVGSGPGEGASVNVAWPAGGLRDGDYVTAFDLLVVPIAREFAPDVILISAGYDAAEGDPIGGCHLSAAVFGHMSWALAALAPCAALLEGGYNLLATARATEATARALLGERPRPLAPEDLRQTAAGRAGLAQALRAQAPHWACVRGLLSAAQLAARPPAWGEGAWGPRLGAPIARDDSAASCGEDEWDEEEEGGQDLRGLRLKSAEDEEEDDEEDDDEGADKQFHPSASWWRAGGGGDRTPEAGALLGEDSGASLGVKPPAPQPSLPPLRSAERTPVALAPHAVLCTPSTSLEGGAGDDAAGLGCRGSDEAGIARESEGLSRENASLLGKGPAPGLDRRESAAQAEPQPKRLRTVSAAELEA